MNVNFYMLENHFQQKLSIMNEDVQFFKTLLKDWKSENPDELNTEVPNYNQLLCTLNHLENAIKVVKTDLLDNYQLKNKALLDRFNNLRKFAGE